MPNWNFVKRQLKFDKPRYLFTKTHKPKMKTHLFYDKTMHYIYIYLIETRNVFKKNKRRRIKKEKIITQG